jgi:H+/Cl- antiporter ClcA
MWSMTGLNGTPVRWLGQRSHRALGLAALVGVVTGGVVALFDWLADEVLLDTVLGWPTVAQALAPLLGLGLAAAALRWLAGRATPATADEYIRNFHDPLRLLDLRPVAGRLAAALATLGFGGALGYEGPSIYAGAAIGSGLQRRLSRLFTADDTKVLMVAGAAAGVAAIFVVVDQRVDDAVRAMDAAGMDRVAVTDRDRFVGLVSVDDIVRLDDVIDRTRYGSGASG